MTAFSVQTGTLRAFSGVLADGGHSIDLGRSFSSTARTYVDTYMPVPYDDGDLYRDIYLNNRQVVSSLQSSTTSVGTLLVQSAEALTSSAREYRRRDAAAVAELDAAYPGKAVAVPESLGGMSLSAGLVDPDPRLDGVPSTSAPVPDMVQWVMDKAGWASISGLALKIASLFGLDPAAELIKAVVGDYGELAQAGHAAEALAEFERVAAETLLSGAHAMEWTGRAADEALTWFTDMANALETHAGQLDSLGEKYALLVQHCAELATALSSALATCIDSILIIVADLAAAGCLASVPGINAIIALIGAYQVWKTTEAVAAFLKITGNVYYGVSGLLAAVTGLAAWAEDGDITAALPTTPYVNQSFA